MAQEHVPIIGSRPVSRHKRFTTDTFIQRFKVDTESNVRYKRKCLCSLFMFGWIDDKHELKSDDNALRIIFSIDDSTWTTD